MQEYKIILTWEAIYDVTDIADYIEEEFGQQRADRFQSDLKEQMQNLGQFSTAFPRTQILYRGYSIHKRSFPPSIIFYIIMEGKYSLQGTTQGRYLTGGVPPVRFSM